MAKSAFPKRQKCAPRKYTESEVNKKLQELEMDLTRHHTNLLCAAFALAMHRILGTEGEQISAVLDELNRLSFEALSFSELQEKVMEETGVEIVHWMDKEE